MAPYVEQMRDSSNTLNILERVLLSRMATRGGRENLAYFRRGSRIVEHITTVKILAEQVLAGSGRPIIFIIKSYKRIQNIKLEDTSTR